MNDGAFKLRDRLRQERDALIAKFNAGGSVDALLHGLARAADHLLREVAESSGITRRATLIAVGGYGRGELFPHSDVDILILLKQAPNEADRATIEDLVGLLWDLGLAPGHSVRTLEECHEEAARDVTVLTSMLESRLIAGSRRHFETFSRAVVDVVDREAYYRAKLLEQQQRHTKYNETPYSLEPNVKESPGGLRDLHVVLWIARAAGYGTHWSELARRGLLTAAEANIIRLSERRVKEIRARLHLVTGRREDRLVFDVQNAVAQQAGFQPTAGKRASELLMQHYYRAAKVITQMNTAVLLNIEQRLLHRDDEPGVAIDATFVARGELLDIEDEAALARDPNGILRAFLLKAQHQELKGMSPRLMRALWHARVGINGAYRREPRNRATFIELLQQPKGVLHELRRMNQLSVLGRYLPVFRRIVGQMQHDLFHVYTVDQHIIQVLRNLRRFSLAEHAHEYPLCSQLIADFDKPWLLYIAALFHDIAKGRGGDHSELGARDARRFCREHGLDRHDTGSRRVPGEAPPDDVAGRAEAGPRRRSGDPRLRRRRAVGALAGRAVPADGGRHPRHEPEGVECLEGQADRRLVSLDPAAARRRHRRGLGRPRGPQAGGAAHPAAVRPVRRRPQRAVGPVRHRLLPAPQRAGHRLAHALAVLPRQHREAGGARAAGTHRRRRRGADLREGPEGPVRARLRLFRQPQPEHPRRPHPHHAPRLRARHLPDHRPRPRAPLPRTAEPGRARTRGLDRRAARTADPGEGTHVDGSRATSRSRRACTCCRTSADRSTC